MSSPERQLRLIQGGLIVFIVVCLFVKRIGKVETRVAISPVQWLVIVAAIWSAISGFTVQRRINPHWRSISNAEKVDATWAMADGTPSSPLDCNSSWLVGTCSALLRRS